MTEGQLTGLDLLTYDTWYQDSDGVHTPYSIVSFPGATQANDPSVTSLSRERRKCDGTQYTEYWKLYAFSFLRINKDDGYHPRCQHPLQSGQYTIESHDEPFDISIGNSAIAGCTRVHYSTDRDPTPESPYVTLDASGNGTKPIHVDAGCALKFRTYRDAPANKPEDGYVASAVDKRTFTVTAPNKNPKKYADGDGIITAPLVATVGTGPLVSSYATRLCHLALS